MKASTRKKVSVIACAAALLLALSACSGNGIESVGAFLGFDKGIDEVKIAVAVPYEYTEANTYFLRGVELAQQEIAAAEKPIAVTVEVGDDDGSFFDATKLAQDYIDDPEVVGVIGHWYSGICSGLTDTYNRSEKVLVVPTVSIANLTSEETPYIFQNIPNDALIGAALCDYAKEQGLSNMVVYYEDSTYGFSMASVVEKYAASVGINVVDRLCSVTKNELKYAIKKWNALSYDSVLLISNVEEGTQFINDLRELGSTAQVLCSDGMDSGSVVNLLDEQSGDITVASIYNPATSVPATREFIDKFEAAYGYEPDVWALQGYDCVRLIADAVIDGGVRTSDELRAYLSGAESLESIFGEVRFGEDNVVLNKTVYLKRVSSSGIEFIK